jgi:hypothetical protein
VQLEKRLFGKKRTTFNRDLTRDKKKGPKNIRLRNGFIHVTNEMTRTVKRFIELCGGSITLAAMCMELKGDALRIWEYKSINSKKWAKIQSCVEHLENGGDIKDLNPNATDEYLLAEPSQEIQNKLKKLLKYWGTMGTIKKQFGFTQHNTNSKMQKGTIRNIERAYAETFGTDKI